MSLEQRASPMKIKGTIENTKIKWYKEFTINGFLRNIGISLTSMSFSTLITRNEGQLLIKCSVCRKIAKSFSNLLAP